MISFVHSLDSDLLYNTLEYIFRVEEFELSEPMKLNDRNSIWEAYEEYKKLVGAEQALQSIIKAMGTDELVSSLAYIFRMNDFEEAYK